ncbi:MAG: hypothetical protein ABWK53_10000 [Anaerolineales bacterium]
MPLPEFLALPLFRLIYPWVRRMEGSPAAPIRRRVISLDPRISYEFNRLFNTWLPRRAEQPIEYDLPYPKIDFLNYLCDWRGLVAHGSNQPNLKTLEPIRLSRDVTDFGNRQQIFASPDAIWALWFAILDREKYRRTRNGCVAIGGGERREKYYHFELERALAGQFPFTAGTLYFARPEDFPWRHRLWALDLFGGEYEEWGSEAPVRPIAQIRVEPADFPYLDRVEYCL